MKINRRKFLKTGTTAAISAGLLATLPEIAKGQNNRNIKSALTSSEENPSLYELSAKLTKVDFINQQGTVFKISSETNGSTTIILTDVTDLPSLNDKKNLIDGYSLLFKVKGRKTLVQDTYLVNHPTLGSFYFLLVPVLYSEREPVFCYEAIVTRYM